MYPISSALSRKLIGTSTRPYADTPKNDVSSRAELCETIATRSPCSTPSASRPGGLGARAGGATSRHVSCTERLRGLVGLVDDADPIAVDELGPLEEVEHGQRYTHGALLSGSPGPARLVRCRPAPWPVWWEGTRVIDCVSCRSRRCASPTTARRRRCLFVPPGAGGGAADPVRPRRAPVEGRSDHADDRRRASAGVPAPRSRSWTAPGTANGAPRASTDEDVRRPMSRAACRVPTNHAQLTTDWRAVETAAARRRRRASPVRPVTRASRWARCSACRSSPTCRQSSPRCSRSAASWTTRCATS